MEFFDLPLNLRRAYVGTKGSTLYTDEYARERFKSTDPLDSEWIRRAITPRTFEILRDHLVSTTYPVHTVDLTSPYGKNEPTTYLKFIRGLFTTHILGRTRCASGGINRRPFLTGVDDLRHGLINTSFSFPLTKFLARDPTPESGAAWLLSCLSYSDSASLWHPVGVAKLLCRYARSFDHVVAVCGSWGSVTIACDIVHGTHHIRKHTCIDVIDDLKCLDTCHDWPFEYHTIIHPSQTVRLDEPGTTFVWNPPYFCVELYDIDDTTNRQNEMQSTSSNPSISDWILSYIMPTAKTMLDAAAPSARLLFVTTDVITVHGSMHQHVNVDGFVKRGGMYIYDSFHETLVNTIQDIGWRRLETTTLRRVSQGTGKNEVLTVFERDIDGR